MRSPSLAKRHRPLLTAVVAAVISVPGFAGTTIDLAAEASSPAANDQVRASVFAEASGSTPGELAKKINAQITEGLRIAKTFPVVRSRSGATNTYPNYAKGGRVDSWRMRSEILLESTDTVAMSELVGKLQANLGVGQLLLAPADATRKRAEDEATLAALTAFRERAARVAAALGKTWRIKHLALNMPQRPPIMPMLRSSAMVASEAMPLEGGESQISVNVSGQIELAD